MITGKRNPFIINHAFFIGCLFMILNTSWSKAQPFNDWLISNKGYPNVPHIYAFVSVNKNNLFQNNKVKFLSEGNRKYNQKGQLVEETVDGDFEIRTTTFEYNWFDSLSQVRTLLTYGPLMKLTYKPIGEGLPKADSIEIRKEFSYNNFMKISQIMVFMNDTLVESYNYDYDSLNRVKCEIIKRIGLNNVDIDSSAYEYKNNCISCYKFRNDMKSDIVKYCFSLDSNLVYIQSNDQFRTWVWDGETAPLYYYLIDIYGGYFQIWSYSYRKKVTKISNTIYDKNAYVMQIDYKIRFKKDNIVKTIIEKNYNLNYIQKSNYKYNKNGLITEIITIQKSKSYKGIERYINKNQFFYDYW